MKLVNITSLLVVAAISFLSSFTVSAVERSDEVNILTKNLRHLGTGEKPIKGAAKKEKKVKGDATDKEKLPPKIKGGGDKTKEKGVKGEESEGSSKASKTKPPKVPESKTKKPSEVFESDYPSTVVSDVPSEVPV